MVILDLKQNTLLTSRDMYEAQFLYESEIIMVVHGMAL